jgi:hypothetical protein
MEKFNRIAAGKNLIRAKRFEFCAVEIQMKIFIPVTILILALAASGCVSKSKADAQARAAFFAGERAAYESMSARTNVTVLGDVQNHQVPWVDGLTLAQAIATASYTGLNNPKEIIVKRQGGAEINVNPQDLLRGQNVPLQQGDTVTIRQ